MKTLLSAFVAGALALLAITVWAFRAHSHEPYSKWQRNDGKGSCCNNMDCRPVEWRTGVAGDIEIKIVELDGAWRAAPNATILPFSSPDGRGHACYLMENGRPRFLCVALPTNG